MPSPTREQVERGVGRLRVSTPQGAGIVKGWRSASNGQLLVEVSRDLGPDVIYPVNHVLVLCPKRAPGRMLRFGPLRLDVNPARLGRPQFSRGPGWVAVSWGNGWDNPVWSVELELPNIKRRTQ